LTGDSAGGNLAASVTIALNEIRRNNGKNVIKMPVGVVVQYPYPDPTLINTPSNALSPITPLINGKGILTLPLVYPPTGLLTPREDWFEREQEIETWCNIVKPCYVEPLINNFAYKHFDELSDVFFNANVCEFDPIIDEGLIIAKKWPQGTVDVVSDIHGWCALGQYSTHKKNFDQMFSRMASALNIKVKNE
jgi:acetyl esterase/lipase